jgi:hypothetical protein
VCADITQRSYIPSQKETVCQWWHRSILLNERWHSWLNWRIYIEILFTTYWIASTRSIIEVFHIREVIWSLDTTAFHEIFLHLWVCVCICRKQIEICFFNKISFHIEKSDSSMKMKFKTYLKIFLRVTFNGRVIKDLASKLGETMVWSLQINKLHKF